VDNPLKKEDIRHETTTEPSLDDWIM
jgi:hypothetical protein